MSEPPALVVGIGASASGLAAFKTFLRHTPSETGMAFVLVQHLDPHHKSLLAKLLGGAKSHSSRGRLQCPSPLALSKSADRLSPDAWQWHQGIGLPAVFRARDPRASPSMGRLPQLAPCHFSP